jgi:polyphenol oxidase
VSDFIYPDWPAPAAVRALTTTRVGGVSTGSFASMNLADHVGDDLNAVIANRRALRGRVPALAAEPLWLRQVHGCGVVCAEDQTSQVEADAVVSRSDARVCAILSADCLPLLLCDSDASVVAAAHAGWRGLSAGVIEATVAAMRVAPGQLMAWLGPAIGPRAFEVGDDVRAAFVARDSAAASAFVSTGGGKWLCDLYSLARMRLASLGVARVFGGDCCTYSEPERFFSYRRDGETGRMATLIWLDRPNRRV